MNREPSIWMIIGRVKDDIEIYWRDTTGMEPVLGVMIGASLVLAIVGGCMASHAAEARRDRKDDSR